MTDELFKGATELEGRAIREIAALAMDAPAAAKSGHSGTAMALAPLGVMLFSRVLRHDPTDSKWSDRDRFILSFLCIFKADINGHNDEDNCAREGNNNNLWLLLLVVVVFFLLLLGLVLLRKQWLILGRIKQDKLLTINVHKMNRINSLVCNRNSKLLSMRMI
jgi:hypothetical protein